MNLNDLMEKLNGLEEISQEEKDLLAKIAAKQEVENKESVVEKRPARKVAFIDDRREYGQTRSMTEIVSLPARLLKDEEKELVEFNDNCVIMSALLKTDPRNLKYFQQFQASNSTLKKAMDSATAAEGTEWVPALLSATLLEAYRMEAVVPSLFTEVTMPNNPYKYPYSAGLSASNFYLIGESISDSPTASPPSTMATSSVTLTAKKLKARVYFSEELTESSIVPVLPALRAELVRAMGGCVEDIVINGDTTATHQDSDVTSSQDRRKAWNGLRDLCQSGNKVDLSTFNYANHRSVVVSMAKYGLRPSELAIISGAKGINKYRGLTEVITVDKYGPQAFVLNGELAKLDGIPLVASEYVRENLNATAVYDAITTTYTESIYVNKRGFLLGNWLSPKLTFKDDAEVDQNQLIIRFYKAFQPVWTPSSTVTTIGIAYKMS